MSNILYVEDDEISREIMQVIVCDLMGIENLTIFSDSQNFLERVQALNPQPTLFLLDIHVPPYDGFKMLKMLHEHPQYQAARVIALTASVMNEEVEQLKHAGFDGIIAKPIDMDSFPTLLQKIMNGDAVWSVVN